MNKIEYAIKLAVKELLRAELGWLNFVVGVSNLIMMFTLSIAYLNAHGEATTTELTEMASGMEIIVAAVVAAPLVMVAGSIAAKVLRNRYWPEARGELWPEVEL